MTKTTNAMSAMNAANNASSPKYLAQLAVKALLYEVSLPDKPGLVSPTGNPGHPDMDIFTFIDSALALQPYFEKLAQLGESFRTDSQEEDLPELFSAARKLGLDAEKDMLQATNGVNTHKGAIFLLGIAVTATAYNGGSKLPDIQETIKKMLVNLSARDFEKISRKDKKDLTAGEKQFAEYGLKGIRGEAENGFPTVFNTALPFLNQSQGELKERLMDTFMRIVLVLPDSNLIKRAKSVEILGWMQEQSALYFKSENKQKFTKCLKDNMLKKNLSLGGTADILIVTVFFALLKRTI
ncbi:triphosphoribosyl-dephospho-CoA synthase [Lactovum odontotermitis]